MFTTLIVQPIFNLLVLIYALLPGHNFGLAIIIFTVVIRMLMWPLVKKQLHNAKAMRALQPDLKRIKKAAAGDRQKESMLVMELYKERGVNPFSSLGIIILQLPILLGLYSGLRRIIDDPQNLVSFAYPWVQNLSWLKELAGDISKFDHNLFGIVDLSRSAWGNGPTYWPAMVLVLASALSQYYQSKQLMPDDKDARKVRAAVRVPLVLLGGIVSADNMRQAMEEGFDFVALGRALIADPDLIVRIARGENARTRCIQCNRCVAEIDRDGVRCVLDDPVRA